MARERLPEQTLALQSSKQVGISSRQSADAACWQAAAGCAVTFLSIAMICAMICLALGAPRGQSAHRCRTPEMNCKCSATE